MCFADFYFERQRNFQVKIQDKTQDDLKYIVVIPCYYEFDLLKTLNSIWNAHRIKSAIEVIIVINSPETASQEVKDQNIITYNEVKNWILNHDDSSLRFFILQEENLPKKFAGAGLARKIGMDQAIHRFNLIKNENGVIISLDADAEIKSNYFTELENHFKKNPKTNAVTTYFEHAIKGAEFKDSIYKAAAIYELYLRYYKLALQYCGFPYAFYTVGSCFAVKAKAYVKQGGMSRKQAGEDFYFLHKIFPLGNCYEINSTCVYPSPRPSNRVPFGTGPMVKTISEQTDEFLTYNLEAFIELKEFFSQVEKFYRVKDNEFEKVIKQIPESIGSYLIKNDFNRAVQEINENSSNLQSFIKRFYNWFDAFRILKYLNFSHEVYYNKKPLLGEAQKLYQLFNSRNMVKNNCNGLLDQFREFERQF